MAKSTRRLGRGLNSLVSDLRSAPPPETMEATQSDRPRSDHSRTDRPDHSESPDRPVARMVAIDDLRPNPFQPRESADQSDVSSLADSIAQSGLLQPITVRPKSGRYEIVAGERRWRAARAAGLVEVPVIVRDATDEQMLELALIENIQREDLNAVDRARGYRELCERFHTTPDEVAKKLGEDRTTIVNYIRLLDLPEAIQDMLANRLLGMGHARCLLGVPDDARRIQLAEAAVRNELSVRALEEIVRRERTRGGDGAAAGSAPAAREPRPRSAHLRDLEQRFEERLKTKVTIQEGKRKGSGRLVIQYYSLDDFDRIASLLGIPLD